jgi:dethiobiotin synthase
MKGCFITATGTGSGKTILTAALLRALTEQNRRALAAKPVQTGGLLSDRSPANPLDLRVYQQANPALYENLGDGAVSPFCFSEPCSPHLAARLDDRPAARVEAIVEHMEILQERCDFLLVEGAGGIRVPLNPEETMLELALALDMPILVVVDNRLGAINHALLTLECLQKTNATLLGIVVNHPSRPTAEEEILRQDNPRIIRHFSGVPILAEIPYLKDFSKGSLSHWQKISRLLKPVAELLCGTSPRTPE